MIKALTLRTSTSRQATARAGEALVEQPGSVSDVLYPYKDRSSFEFR